MYAYFTPNNYTVYFNANGGNTPNPTSKIVTFDSTYGTLASVSRTGYTFNGWYTAASGGTQVTDSTKVSITSDQTLYAHWTANSYSVSISAGTGGSVSTTSISINYGGTNNFTVTPNSGYYLESISCTNGYTANGFTTTSTSTETQIVIINNNSKATNSTCTIKFAKNEIQLTIKNGSATNANGPTNGDAGVIVTYPTSGYNITYGTTAGKYDLTSVPTYYVAGIYTIYYQVTAPNLTTKTGSFTITISDSSYYVFTWSTSLSQYGSYIGTGNAASTTSNYGGKRLKYINTSGQTVYANIYSPGSITIKAGTTIYIEMFASNVYVYSDIHWSNEYPANHTPCDGGISGSLISYGYTPTSGGILTKSVDWKDSNYGQYVWTVWHTP